MRGIVQHLSFCSWLLLLSIMSSRFIHVGSGVRLSFLSKIPLSVSITFVYSFIHWWFLTDPVSTLVAEWQISSCGIPSTSTSWPSALFLFFTIHLSIYHCYKLMNPTLEWFLIRSSLVAQTVKHLSTMRETWVRSLGWEDSLEKEMATHSSTLALKIRWTEELGAGYCPWGCKGSGTTERFHFHFLICYYTIWGLKFYARCGQ